MNVAEVQKVDASVNTMARSGIEVKHSIITPAAADTTAATSAATAAAVRTTLYLQISPFMALPIKWASLKKKNGSTMWLLTWNRTLIALCVLMYMKTIQRRGISNHFISVTLDLHFTNYIRKHI